MGRSDIELNARGAAQVEAVAEALRHLPVRAVLASPQRRAQQTAEAIARPHKLAVRTEPALAEVWVGRWQGTTWRELQDDPDVTRYIADPTYICDAVEPGTGVHERTVSFVEQLRSDARDRIVVVSHGDPLRILLAHYLGMPLASYRCLQVSPASVSVVRFDKRFGVRVPLLNWRPEQRMDQFAKADTIPLPPQSV